MCTTASVIMCLAALCKVVTRLGLKRAMDNSMAVASVLHGRLVSELGHRFMSVYDILNSPTMRGVRHRIDCEEVIVFPESLPHFGDAVLTTGDVLSKVDEDRCAVMTSNGHSMCIFKTSNLYHLFDSMKAECQITSNAVTAELALDQFGRGQKDVSFLKLRDEKTNDELNAHAIERV